MAVFNEDTRVKIPATIQFMRNGYEYQSLKDINLHSETRIDLDRFKKAIEKINGRVFTQHEIEDIVEKINAVIKINDMGKSFHSWLIHPNDKIKLIDFENIENNIFSVVDELSFGKEGSESVKDGSFRPDITAMINGIPLAFLEVKKPDNEGGIQKEFDRMLNQRLKNPDYKKYFNMLQIVTFSNNMEYEDDDFAFAEDVKAGSFYTTPNGQKTTFSFFREEQPKTTGFVEISEDKIRSVLKDNHYSPSEYDTPEFQTNLDGDTPCNRFITSIFDKERFLYFIHYGMLFINSHVDEKHIMRYPQFFASRAIVKKLENGGKSSIIWHTQGSGKTSLAAFSTRILRDFYASQGITTRFYYVVDRLDLLTQVSGEMQKRGLHVINVDTKKDFEKELNKTIASHTALDADGEITVVNIQKFDEDLPVAKNAYNAKIQRVFYVDESHRSYKSDGTYYANLMGVDTDAVFLGLTGTPLLSKKERSSLKFGDYVHKYFYDKSIADGYTLRIKKEAIETTARAEIKKNLELENPTIGRSELFETDDYIDALCKFINKDFENFRLTNNDNTIGGMIVCSSNNQAWKIKNWMDNNSKFNVGIVLSDPKLPSAVNKQTQIEFKEGLKIDILVVHQMLTTGYDVNRLKKMYLLRNAKEHTLLQTISRVNRPYRHTDDKGNLHVYRYGYIVDFVDITEEYDRTIEMYLKELESDFEDNTLNGLIVNAEDINKKYQKYLAELSSIVQTSNKEVFRQSLDNMSKDTLLTIRRLLNGIKTCYAEFRLSHAKEYYKDIDIDHIKSLLTILQLHIDLLNVRSRPKEFLSAISNDEVCDIFYEFFKSKVTVMDFKKFERGLAWLHFKELVDAIQDELRANQNHNQIELVKLDEALQELFEELDISNIDDINEELQELIEEARRINQENEALASRFGSNYAFVKTYTDMIETHPELDKDGLLSVMDVVYNAVKVIESSNLLILQGRQTFVSTVNEQTIVTLINNDLYFTYELDSWYDEFLINLYSNLKMF